MLRTNILPPIATHHSDLRMLALRGGGKTGDIEKARLGAVAKEFETLMVEMMVKSMRSNVPESPIFGRDNGREIFQEMLDGEYARLMTANRGFGISESLIAQLKSKL